MPKHILSALAVQKRPFSQKKRTNTCAPKTLKGEREI